MLLLEDMFFYRLSRGNGIVQRLDDAEEIRMLKKFPSYKRHIPGTSIVILIVKPVRIGKI